MKHSICNLTKKHKGPDSKYQHKLIKEAQNYNFDFYKMVTNKFQQEDIQNKERLNESKEENKEDTSDGESERPMQRDQGGLEQCVYQGGPMDCWAKLKMGKTHYGLVR